MCIPSSVGSLPGCEPVSPMLDARWKHTFFNLIRKKLRSKKKKYAPTGHRIRYLLKNVYKRPVTCEHVIVLIRRSRGPHLTHDIRTFVQKKSTKTRITYPPGNANNGQRSYVKTLDVHTQ